MALGTRRTARPHPRLAPFAEGRCTIPGTEVLLDASSYEVGQGKVLRRNGRISAVTQALPCGLSTAGHLGASQRRAADGLLVYRPVLATGPAVGAGLT